MNIDFKKKALYVLDRYPDADNETLLHKLQILILVKKVI